MRTFTLIGVLAFLFTACVNSDTKKDAATDTPEEEAPAQKYTITPFSESTAYPDATIAAMTFQDGKFDFTVESEEYELGTQTPDAQQKMCANSEKGQHIHLIVNDAPYAAKYESSFDYEIEDGEHHLLAFLSRSYHESIKTDAASVTKKITVANNSITAEEDITEPMLFYSRPKGTYVGKANTQKVMLDFFVVNAKLGTDYSVKANINGEEHTFTKWQPYYIEGLPMGENTIELTLLDKEGNTVDTPLNPVSRTFTLQQDPAEETE